MTESWRQGRLGDLLPFAYGKSLPETKRNANGDFVVFGSNGPVGFHTESLVKQPGVVIGRKGSIGNVHYSAKPFWPIDTTFFVVGNDSVDVRFAYYLLGNIGLTSMNSDSAVPGLNRDDAHSVLISLPPIREQRAIAEVLGALDDKIESNKRIVRKVMELSTAVFDQWRSSVRDWTTTTFGDFSAVFGGATPKTGNPDYWDGPHCWLTPTDVTHLDSIYLSSSARTITDAGLAAASTQLHPPGTIFMTSRATIGAFAVNEVPCAPNQGFIAVQPDRENQRWFLFHEMSRRVSEMLDRANGTTFREISRGSFKSMELQVPSDDSVHRGLDAEVSPLHARAAQAVSESSLLAATRDSLLPELLSGRIQVPDTVDLFEAS